VATTAAISQNPAITILRKRDGKELSDKEIREFVAGVTSGEIPEYQATAFLMAVFFRGMSFDETVSLTRAMLESGFRYDLSKIKGTKVDKHSTGGVGDKVSLILAPLAVACGLKVPMMAGRGLGHSGGTLDKLEAISGFNVRPPRDTFEKMLADPGCAIIGQSEQIAPADKKLYSLRDVTGTVECIPLIVASILSKKLAEGTDALVMDVKVGNGAFMKNREQARKLARALIQVARKMDLPCRALLTDMSQPLGYTAGNALEVKECIEILQTGKSEEGNSADLKELTVQLCAHMLELGKAVKSLAEGRKLAHSRLADGSAWKIFQEMVKGQGGSVDQIQSPSKLPQAPHTVTWTAKKRGYVNWMDTQALGWILVDLGGGRRKASDTVDPGVGFVFQKKLGAKVQVGDPLVTVHYTNAEAIPALEERFHQAIEIGTARKAVPKLIVDQLG
jgi:pyrimidine-nucleoside phosphorylase